MKVHFESFTFGGAKRIIIGYNNSSTNYKQTSSFSSLHILLFSLHSTNLTFRGYVTSILSKNLYLRLVANIEKKNIEIFVVVKDRCIIELILQLQSNANPKAGKFIASNRLKGLLVTRKIPLSFSAKIASRSDTIASPAAGLAVDDSASGYISLHTFYYTKLQFDRS